MFDILGSMSTPADTGAPDSVSEPDGGATSALNSRGVCQFHNLLREQPAWTVARTADGVRTTTPTGHRYLSNPVPPCG